MNEKPFEVKIHDVHLDADYADWLRNGTAFGKEGSTQREASPERTRKRAEEDDLRFAESFERLLKEAKKDDNIPGSNLNG